MISLESIRFQKCVVLLVLYVLFSKSAQAAPRQEFYIQQAINRYYQLPHDARALATYGSTSLFCRDSGCIYMNPAGLGFMRSSEVSGSLGMSQITGDEFLSSEQIEQSEVKGYLTAAFSLGSGEVSRFGSLAIGYSRYNGETDDAIQSKPDGHRRSLAYGIALSDRVSVGYGFTFYDDQLHSDLADLHSHARFLHVLGASYKASEDWEFGGDVRIGTGQSDTEDYLYESNGLSKPRQYSMNVGFARHLEAISIFGGFEFTRLHSDGDLRDVSTPVVIGNNERGDVYDLKIGIETHPRHGFILRSGVGWYHVGKYEFDRAELQDLSGKVSGVTVAAGIGYLYGGETVNTATARVDLGVHYSAVGRGDWEQLVSLAIPL